VTVDKVVPEISKYGGTVLRTSLSDDAEERLRAALAQRSTAGTPPVAAPPTTTDTPSQQA
jgi:uncharacterized membrane protein